MHEQDSPEPSAKKLEQACEGLGELASDARPSRTKRSDAFARVSWSFASCVITLGLLVAFRGVFPLLRRVNDRGDSHTLVILSWLMMFVFMGALPLWITWRGGTLQRPRVGRILREFGLAVPPLIGLLLAQGALVLALTHISRAGIEFGAPMAPLRDAPNEPRLYLLLIPMFTLGPLAEELFFRGFLYNALRQWMAPLLAVVLQALVFTLIHYKMPYAGIADLTIVFSTGLALVGVYEWRKTLWASIALHSLRNLLFAGPVIVLMILNSHVPAKTWAQAEQPPAWLSRGWLPIEKQAGGEAQRLHAIDMWGSKGLHLWKQEIRAMEAVCAWFPQDRRACARAREGIAMIFRVYLRDPRRAIVQSNWVLSEFPDQTESCAGALFTQADAYRDIGEDQRSREAYREIVRSYGTLEWARKAAEQELQNLGGE